MTQFKGGPTANRKTPAVNQGALATAGRSDFRGGPSKEKPGDSGDHTAALASHSGDGGGFRGGASPDRGHTGGNTPASGPAKGPAVTPKRGPKAPPKPKQTMQPSRRAPARPMRDDPAPAEPMAGPADELAPSPGNTEATPEGDKGPATKMPADAAQGGPGSPDDPKARELFDLAVARTLEAISQQSDVLDTALKADPVKAAVGFGTSSLHAVAQSADDAGKTIPFQILIQVAVQVIKVIGSIALEKGYLAEEAIEPFLKEAFQQSLAKYLQLDMQAGKISQEQVSMVQNKLQQSAQPGAMPQAAAGAAPPGAMPPAPPPEGAL